MTDTPLYCIIATGTGLRCVGPFPTVDTASARLVHHEIGVDSIIVPLRGMRRGQVVYQVTVERPT